MGKITYVTSAEYKMPVIVSYTCRHCGKEVRLEEDLFLQGSISGLKWDDAEKLLASSLPYDTVQQLEHIADYAKKHGIVIPNDPRKAMKVRKAIMFECPHCHTFQVPDAGGKPAVLTGGRRSISVSSILALLLLFGWLIGMCAVLAQRQVNPMNLLYITLAAVAGCVALFTGGRLMKKRAFRDPDYMLKHFRSVLNPEVYMDFTPYGLGRILVNSEK